MSNDEIADVLERPFEVDGIKGIIKIVTHPTGRAMIVDIQAKQMLSPVFIELALYDVAAMIARQHGIVETMKKIKESAWT